MNFAVARDASPTTGVAHAMTVRKFRPFAWLLAAALVALPLTASAQPVSDETISGSIASIDDDGNMNLSDSRGYTDAVQVGQDTIIRPAGSRLQPGMSVMITGVNRGSYFAAERVEIATQAQPDGPVPAAGPPGPPPDDASALPAQFVHSGELTGSLDTPLDSRHAAVGDNVVLTDVSSADGSIRHATLSGTVSEVTRPGQGRNAQIEIAFDLLQLRDGSSYHVTGVVTSMQVATKSNTLKEVGGALIGMLAGNAIAKTAFGISGGGIAGAVGGYFVAKDNRADVVVPDHSAISVRLIRARRQAS
jgi:hypothetical protein